MFNQTIVPMNTNICVPIKYSRIHFSITFQYTSLLHCTENYCTVKGDRVVLAIMLLYFTFQYRDFILLSKVMLSGLEIRCRSVVITSVILAGACPH